MTLRRLLEARMGKQGKREFVQVLRLLEVFQFDDVTAGVRDAIERGVIGFDAVKHLLLCRLEHRPAKLDMTVYPYLPRTNVATTTARSYLDLLTGWRHERHAAGHTPRPAAASAGPPSEGAEAADLPARV
jgi:hypothetical protein